MLDIMEIKLKHFIVLATVLVPMAHAHSWVEELTLLAPNGSFVGPRGYPRGMVQRTASFQDDMMEWQLPSGTNDQITPNMAICKPSQQTANYTPDNPILKAPAGSSIALRYQENGHVTQPWIPSGKPEGSGAVYVYGTTQPSEDDTLIDIYQNWTLDGTGGDGRGRLLTSQFFDDGQCYQVSDAPISVERQKKFPRKAETGSVEGANLWCQTDVKLPSDLSVGALYTLYWVWDWSTMNTSTSVARPQFYTTCMDVSISDSNNALVSEQGGVPFASITNYGEAAISTVFENLASTVTVPTSLTPGYFTAQSMITSLPTSATASTSTPVTTASSPATSLVGGGGAAIQQLTQSACSITSTITTTAVSVSTTTVTVTVTGPIAAVLAQSSTTMLPSSAQRARMARRRLFGFAGA